MRSRLWCAGSVPVVWGFLVGAPVEVQRQALWWLVVAVVVGAWGWQACRNWYNRWRQSKGVWR